MFGSVLHCILMTMLDQSNDIITRLEGHIIVRSAYHNPSQVNALVLLVSVNIQQSSDGQTEGPGISQSSGEQL